MYKSILPQCGESSTLSCALHLLAMSDGQSSDLQVHKTEKSHTVEHVVAKDAHYDPAYVKRTLYVSLLFGLRVLDSYSIVVGESTGGFFLS
jgi:hypothetical protein